MYIGKAIRSYVVEPALSPVPRRKPGLPYVVRRPQPVVVKRSRV